MIAFDQMLIDNTCDLHRGSKQTVLQYAWQVLRRKEKRLQYSGTTSLLQQKHITWQRFFRNSTKVSDRRDVVVGGGFSTPATPSPEVGTATGAVAVVAAAGSGGGSD
jgi:hypothetical protein